MTPQEIDGIASAVNRRVEEACAVMRAEFARNLDAVQQAHAEATALHVARTNAQVEALQRDLDATRALAAEPAVRDVLIDAAGDLRVVQRSGPTLTVRCADLPAQSAAAVFSECEDRMNDRLEAVRRSADERIAALTEQNANLEREVVAARALAAEPAVRDILIDAAGDLRIVQRSGPTLVVRCIDLPAQVARAVSDAFSAAEDRMNARLDSNVARAMQRLGDAPRWSPTAAYTPGQVVTFYSGRVYVMRDDEVRVSMGQEPGTHPKVWERIGSNGLRVLKAKPADLEPGDLYADDESRFITDGASTTLLVAKGVKQSDVDRQIKPLAAQVRAACDQSGSVRRDIDAARAELRVVARLAPIADALEQIVRDEFVQQASR